MRHHYLLKDFVVKTYYHIFINKKISRRIRIIFEIEKYKLMPIKFNLNVILLSNHTLLPLSPEFQTFVQKMRHFLPSKSTKL